LHKEGAQNDRVCESLWVMLAMGFPIIL
jgi:hypothetical protein